MTHDPTNTECYLFGCRNIGGNNWKHKTGWIASVRSCTCEPRARPTTRRAEMKYGKSRDHNEKAIVDELRAKGCLVWRLESESEAGIPDLLVGYDGHWFVVEVKTPKGRLSPAQIERRDEASGRKLMHWVISDPDQIGGILMDLKYLRR